MIKAELSHKYQNPIIHPGNLGAFLSVYRECLYACHQSGSDIYYWPISELDTVMIRMSSSIQRGSFNKDSQSFKMSCKRLGIKHTYKAIREFISL